MSRILVVDDSELARNFHCYVFRKAGFAVVPAADGADGLEKLGSERFDLVVTDLHMSGMDGFEFTRQIRSMPEHDELPLMVLSTEVRAESKQESLRAGANLFLAKPTSPDRMIESARMLLGVRSSA
jgi:two-component system, chemotaxis family, chemotaxis protein CheY